MTVQADDRPQECKPLQEIRVSTPNVTLFKGFLCIFTALYWTTQVYSNCFMQVVISRRSSFNLVT